MCFRLTGSVSESSDGFDVTFVSQINSLYEPLRYSLLMGVFTGTRVTPLGADGFKKRVCESTRTSGGWGPERKK